MSSFQYDTIPCKHCKHLGPEVDLVCDNCGRFLISFSRRNSLLLIIAILVSLVLFHVTGSVWPMYMLISMGIVQVYAVIFSRGEVFASVTWLYVGITSLWGVTVLADSLSTSGLLQPIIGPIWLPLKREAQRLSFLIPLFFWILGTIWGVYLGRNKVTHGVRIAGSFFLGTGAFVFGLWAVWAILIQNAMFRDWVFQLAVLFALVAPLALLVILLKRQPPEGSRGQTVALWLLVITAYLTSTQLLTNLVQDGLGNFLPKILGITPLGKLSQPWLLEILKWRMPISSILSATSVISLAASSVVQAVSEFQAQKPKFYLQSMGRINQMKFQAKNEIDRIGIQIAGMVTEVIYIFVIVGTLAGHIAIHFVENLITTLRKVLIYLIRLVRYLVAPIFSFSLLSILIIVTLQHYQMYNGGSVVFAPQNLWGEALTVMVFVLVLCGASFGFAPAVRARFVYAGTEAVALLGIIVYFLVSLAAIGLPLVWFGFQSVSIDFAGVKPGPIFAINAGATIILMLFLAVTISPVTLIGALRTKIPRIEQIISVSRVALLLIFGGIVILLGMGPIIKTLSSALGNG